MNISGEKYRKVLTTTEVSMQKITVLGAGLVGNAIIQDLAEEFQITAVDLNPKLLAPLEKNSNVNTIQAN